MTVHPDPQQSDGRAPAGTGFWTRAPMPAGEAPVRRRGATVVSGPFQSPDPIDAYLDELRRSLRPQPDASDLMDETEDHLREALAHQLLGGVDPVRAQQVVLAEFGDPRLVANALVRSRTRTVPRATPLTRLAGRAGALAGIAWVASMFVNWWQLTASPWSEEHYLWFSLAMMTATTLTGLLVVGLIVRTGALRTASAMLAMLLLMVALTGNTLTTWVWPFSNLLLTAALAVAVGLSRHEGRAAGARAALWPALLIWPVACAVTMTGDLAGIGPMDEYGDYPMLYEWSFFVAATVFAACCWRLGTALAGEAVPETWTDVVVLDPARAPLPEPAEPAQGDVRPSLLRSAPLLTENRDAPSSTSTRWAPPTP